MAIATDRNAAVMNILRFSDLCAQGKAQGDSDDEDQLEERA